jgi:BlaI family transcriptional regulator, penicillinase repressor
MEQVVSAIVPSERELEALKVLWQRGEASVREICEAINDRGAKLAYTTVLSLLQVMEQKGLVGHRAGGRRYTYFAAISREGTFRQLARGFLDGSSTGRWMSMFCTRSIRTRSVQRNWHGWKH